MCTCVCGDKNRTNKLFDFYFEMLYLWYTFSALSQTKNNHNNILIILHRN